MFRRRIRSEPAQSADAPSEGTSVATIDDESFLASTEGGFTVVDFWAPWCGPCRAFAPVFEEVARRYAEQVHFARCNVDESPATATLLQIRSIPTVIAFGPDGSELGRMVGVPSRAELERAVAGLAEHACRPSRPGPRGWRAAQS